MGELLSFIRDQHKKVTKITDSDAFWMLIDQMVDAKCGFFANRETLLDAYSSGNLYTVYITETDELFEQHSLRMKLYDSLGSGPELTLPCCCVCRGGKCKIIWVRTDLRRVGIGSLFAQELKFTSTTNQLRGSEQFWQHLGLAS